MRDPRYTGTSDDVARLIRQAADTWVRGRPAVVEAPSGVGPSAGYKAKGPVVLVALFGWDRDTVKSFMALLRAVDEISGGFRAVLFTDSPDFDLMRKSGWAIEHHMDEFGFVRNGGRQVWHESVIDRARWLAGTYGAETVVAFGGAKESRHAAMALANHVKLDANVVTALARQTGWVVRDRSEGYSTWRGWLSSVGEGRVSETVQLPGTGGSVTVEGMVGASDRIFTIVHGDSMSASTPGVVLGSALGGWSSLTLRAEGPVSIPEMHLAVAAVQDGLCRRGFSAVVASPQWAVHPGLSDIVFVEHDRRLHHRGTFGERPLQGDPDARWLEDLAVAHRAALALGGMTTDAALGRG